MADEGWLPAIVAHLREEGPDSISGVTRALSLDRERPPHRLTVAGHLAALAEMGVLEELKRPPSLQYRLADPERLWTLHERLGRVVRSSRDSNDEQVRVLVSALVRLLGRPIFGAEIRLAGFDVPDHLPVAEVSEEERRTWRTMWRDDGRLEIPRGDNLYQDAGAPTSAVEPIIRRTLVESAGAQGLAAAESGPRQARLGVPP